jgi:single-strand DNA-binding protein
MNDLITITGNIAAEPELRRTAGGVPVAAFRVASSQRHYDRAKSEWVETATNWYAISAFRELAEHVCTSLHKGERVIVSGRVRMREWETTTKRGVSVEIEADAVGHDLRWGTTRFERSHRTDARPDAWATASQPDAPSGPSGVDRWGADPARDWGGSGEAAGEPEGSVTAQGLIEPPF